MNSKWLRQFIYSVSTLKGKAAPPEEPLLQTTFDKFYVPLLNKDYTPCSRDKLADCIDYAVIEMETAILNNIQVHFVKRQMKYMRAKYPDMEKERTLETTQAVQRRSSVNR